MPPPSPGPSLESLLETSLSTAILPLGKSTLRDLLDSSSEPVTLATPAPLHWCLDPCHQETHLWLEPLIRYVPFLQRLCVPSKQQKPTIYHTWPPHNPSVGWGTDHSIHLKGDHKAMKTTTCRKRPAVRRRRRTCACWIMLSTVFSLNLLETTSVPHPQAFAPALARSWGRVGTALGSSPPVYVGLPFLCFAFGSCPSRSRRREFGKRN